MTSEGVLFTALYGTGTAVPIPTSICSRPPPVVARPRTMLHFRVISCDFRVSRACREPKVEMMRLRSAKIAVSTARQPLVRFLQMTAIFKPNRKRIISPPKAVGKPAGFRVSREGPEGGH